LIAGDTSMLVFLLVSPAIKHETLCKLN